MGLLLYTSSTAVLIVLFCMFTILACFPLWQGFPGNLDMHFHACLGAGEGADQLETSMRTSLQDIVRSIERNTADNLFAGYGVSLTLAILAHGLGLMALFGTTIQANSENSFIEKSAWKSYSSIITWGVTTLAYLVIIALSFGDYQAFESDKDDADFNLNQNCYATNTWLADLDGGLKAKGQRTTMLLLITNVVVGSVQAFVHWKDTS